MSEIESIPSAEALMPVLYFTPQDLAANRLAQLGADQRQRLEALQRRTLALGAAGFLGFALIATVFLFIGQSNESPILELIGLLLVICNAILVGLVSQAWLRLAADLRDPQIDVLSGSLERILHAGRYAQNYRLRVQGVNFAVTKEAFKQFRHQKPYRMYRTRHSKMLLAAEPEL